MPNTFKIGFIKGAEKKGLSQDLSIEIFDLLAKFAEYGFNKSHSAAYSVIAYQTAWLKTHYPAEFMACNLSSELLNTDNIIKFLISIFINYRIFLDLFSQAKLIEKMDWRASQPLNYLLPKELQWSSSSQIGFCGDWFNLNSFGGVESAMNSAIRLAKLVG